MPAVQRVTDLALEQLIGLVENAGGSMEVEAILVAFNEPEIICRASGVAGQGAVEATAEARSLMERLADNPADAYADDEDGRHITEKKG